jgi:hypothetical protein
MSAHQVEDISGYVSWPHPKKAIDPVDPRLVECVFEALDGVHRRRETAELVAEAVWEWFAEGDEV